jgi:hypothetical protein
LAVGTLTLAVPAMPQDEQVHMVHGAGIVRNDAQSAVARNEPDPCAFIVSEYPFLSRHAGDEERKVPVSDAANPRCAAKVHAIT